MTKHQIKTVAAHYTGGGLYIYLGQLESGLYFRTWDEAEAVYICNSDTDTDEAEYSEFYEAHTVEEITGDNFRNFWNTMLTRIINDGKPGNYSRADLEERILK